MLNLFTGNALDILKGMESESVQCIITSPPYFKLRDYKEEGQIGNEKSSLIYTRNLLKVFDECYRVLKPTGSFWLNISDTTINGCMENIPEELSFLITHELGFIKRKTIIWHKPSVLPQGNKNFTTDFEYFYYFAKSKKHIWNCQYEPMQFDYKNLEYNGQATKDYESHKAQNPSDTKRKILEGYKKQKIKYGGNKVSKEVGGLYSGKIYTPNAEGMRVKRSVWKIPVKPFSGAHFATFPPDLIEIPILACSNHGDVILDPFMGCYDKETEVLTNNGFKLFKDLDKEHDLIGDIDDKYNLTFVKPINYFQYKYNGFMYRIKHRSLDLLITPNHNVIYKEHHKNKEESNQIQNIHYRWISLPVSINNYEGNHKEDFDLPILTNLHKSTSNIIQIQKLNMNIFLSFLGYWISEGHVTEDSYQIGITQLKPNIRNNIKLILDKLPYKYLEHYKGFRINNKQLYEYLFKLGKQNKRYIPREFLELSKHQLQLLFNALIEGDGHKNNENDYIYYTISKQLCDDMIELGIKLGFSVTMTSRLRKPIFNKSFNHIVTAKHICYEIHFMKSKRRKLDTYKMITKEFYNDLVYCVEVPNHRLIIKRNGKICICGNSGTVGVVAAKYHRSFIGIDLNESYTTMAAQRIASGK